MNNCKQSYVLVVVAVLVLAYCMQFANAQSSATRPAQHVLTDPEDLGPTYDPRVGNDTQQGMREARGRKHNRPKGRDFQELRNGVQPDPIMPYRATAAIPAADSTAIVVGSVTDAAAHLSEDHHWIYSEFTINIVQVLKNDSLKSLSVDSATVAYREGGSYRFPSGKIQRYRVHQQGFPQKNHEYVFFLREDHDTNDFYIITAYDITNGKVLPLDGREPGSTEIHGSSRYTGWDASTFVADLQQQLRGGDK